MKKFTVFRLIPLGAFHFSSQSNNIDSTSILFGSDQLYSALFVENLQSRVFNQWNEQNPIPCFRISSCFPSIGTLPLLPAPMLPPSRHEPEIKTADRKRIKKIKFISPAILMKRLNGEPILQYVNDSHPTGIPSLWQNGAVVVDPSEIQVEQQRLKERAKADSKGPPLMIGTVWSENATPHVTVDRTTNRPAYFAIKELRFAPHCGLAVLATGTPETLQRLRHLLELLGDSGIGGRRSKGLGQFEVEEHTETLELPDPSTSRVMSLSRYSPTPTELDNGILGTESSYQLIEIGGWISSRTEVPQRRQSITMLREGSVIQSPAMALEGAIHDVRPTYQSQAYSHHVWRFGLAFPIGILGQFKGED